MSINVTSVEPAQRINPGRIGSPDRLDQTSAAQRLDSVRRLTRLDADYFTARQRGPTRGGLSVRPTRHTSTARSDRAWLRLVERVVGGWAPTLRQSVTLVALFLTAAVTVVITLGLVGVLLVTGLCIVLTWLQRTGRAPRG